MAAVRPERRPAARREAVSASFKDASSIWVASRPEVALPPSTVFSSMAEARAGFGAELISDGETVMPFAVAPLAQPVSANARTASMRKEADARVRKSIWSLLLIAGPHKPWPRAAAG